MRLQCNELSGSRDPRHRVVVGTPKTLEQFPPIQYRETDEVRVGRTLAVAWDIRAVQQGEITEHPRRMSLIGNMLSPVIRTSGEVSMRCLERYTKDSIEMIQKEIEKEAYERGVREGMRRQRELDAATDADGVVHLSDLE